MVRFFISHRCTYIYVMLTSFRSLFILLLVLQAGCATVKKQPGTHELSPAALSPVGRFAFNNANQLELISSGVHFRFSFEGTACNILAALPAGAPHNYLQYEVDGVYRQRVKVAPGATQTITINATGSGRHTVTIYKATEAHTGAVLIQNIVGHNLKPIAIPKTPLIEFIGNSITCGASADPSEVPCGTGAYHDQHNAYMAYGPRVARSLGTAFILNSVSGIGIYRNWNSDGPTMPQVYPQTDFQLNSNRPWNFSLFQPQVISIALGTNDFSNGDGKRERKPFDSAQFVSQYIQFVKTVKSKNRSAKLALLSSPMVHGTNRTLLQNCITAVKREIDLFYPADQPVALYFFKPMQARGCTGHPNVEDHALLAAELLPFFKSLLKEKRD